MYAAVRGNNNNRHTGGHSHRHAIILPSPPADDGDMGGLVCLASYLLVGDRMIPYALSAHIPVHEWRGIISKSPPLRTLFLDVGSLY